MQGLNVVQLAQKMLIDHGGWVGLQRLTFHELCQIHGMGEAKAAQVKAALEIGRRLLLAQPEQRPQITSPADVANLLMLEMSHLEQEHLKVVALNTKNLVLRHFTVYIGSINSSAVRVGEVFKEALKQNAAAIIVAHNHPSGDPTPSPEDVAVTKEIVQAGRTAGRGCTRPSCDRAGPLGQPARARARLRRCCGGDFFLIYTREDDSGLSAATATMDNPWLHLPDSELFVLPSDKDAIIKANSKGSADGFIHLELLPEPFLGDINAPVVLLNLNPGYSPDDILQHQHAYFSDVLRKNLRHEALDYPFYLLDPNIGGSGYWWWQRKLRSLIEDVGNQTVARNVFCVEYFPYHSHRFHHRGLIVPSQLYSFSLVRSAMARGAIIILMRSKRLWLDAVPELAKYANFCELKMS